MTSNEPALNLTYDELYEEAQAMLSVLSRNCSSPPDTFDRGCRRGVITLWYSLAMSIKDSGRGYHEDRRQLLLAGLTSESQEPPADVR
ncbi:hypothetical protein N2L35_004657 [Salmonella enterica]|nr:hypothetical protein [Salmonella enterica]EBP4191847.1 hypothetical protein [Salmonella enterica subsp. enterica]EDV2860206.1 hypothetical protein [Salmonella enterica subsp. houtenae]ECK3784387.1 hypothetical protein [Salmonella enterica]EEJ1434363.1 hypothetical protein [Salmonella enterica subsp. houtenae]